MSDGDISVTVRTRVGVEQRSRGGHTFGKVPRTVLVTAEGLKAIEEDPRLNIIKPEPKPEPAPKPKEAKARTSTSK